MNGDPEKPILRVALAVIVRDARWLVQLRPEGSRLAGRWEFPGGKIRPTETAAAAVERECYEELACRVRALRGFEPLTHDYGDWIVSLEASLCEIEPGGVPLPIFAERLEWVTPAELRGMPIPDANHLLIERMERELGGRVL